MIETESKKAAVRRMAELALDDHMGSSVKEVRHTRGGTEIALTGVNSSYPDRIVWFEIKLEEVKEKEAKR